MDTPILKIAFLVGLVFSSIIRIPHQRENKQNIIIDNRKNAQENSLLFLVFLGMFILPIIYIVTPWFNFCQLRIARLG